MTLRYMLDTNICIALLRNRDQTIKPRLASHATEIAISSVVLHELLFGAERSARPVENRIAVDDFASRMEVLPFDNGAAAHAAEIRASLAARGATIGSYDVLIAGHARSRGLSVVTANMREFVRVDGLRCENWINGSA